jgi:hypothetical protein
MGRGTRLAGFGNAFLGAHRVSGMCGSRTKSTKNPPTFIRRRTVRGEFFVREFALPHIDLFGSRHLAVSNDRLPDSVYRIIPDASKQRRRFVKRRKQNSAASAPQTGLGGRLTVR